ncbi:TIGR03790 family protein [Planctomycetota bacterium]|nr:TIGR03790 family protein [Planctomycetota bacterium]
MIRFVLLSLFALSSPLMALTADNVLIVANTKAEGSLEVAEYYAELRGIPTDRILKIETATTEEISREEYDTNILPPIKKYVDANENILCICPVFGVPLKIKKTGKFKKDGHYGGQDGASVDGELALIRIGEYDTNGMVPNIKYYFTKDEEIALEHQVLVTSRLDGPTAEIAKGLVEKAILAETLGGEGQCFLDTRGMGPEKAGYYQRDQIMKKVGEVWTANEIPFYHDDEGKVVDLSTRQMLHYYGWYAGSQSPKGEVKFRTGGVDVHLHSFSGATIRTTKKNWVGKLLSWNATCAYGTCYEPYTSGFPMEHIFWDRLCKGYTFAEAGQMANQLLSWQAVFCGDPLYRPYPRAFKKTDGQQDANRKAVLAALSPEAVYSPRIERKYSDEDGSVIVEDSDSEKDEDDAADAAEDSGVHIPDQNFLVQMSIKLLQARLEAFKNELKKNPKDGLAVFNDLRFLVDGMGLESWIGEASEMVKKQLEKQLKAIKDAVKLDLLDTASLETALKDWGGMPIYEDVLALKADVAATHEKAAAPLLKKAEKAVKREKWLDAYMQAAEAAAYTFSASGVTATTILDDIKANAEAVAEMTEDANKALANKVKKAEKEVEKKRWERALKSLPKDWVYYPECEERAKAKVVADACKVGME